jgi:hypothetical protein
LTDKPKGAAARLATRLPSAHEEADDEAEAQANEPDDADDP